MCVKMTKVDWASDTGARAARIRVEFITKESWTEMLVVKDATTTLVAKK